MAKHNTNAVRFRGAHTHHHTAYNEMCLLLPQRGLSHQVTITTTRTILQPQRSTGHPYLDGEVSVANYGSCLLLSDALGGQVDTARLEIRARLVLRLWKLFPDLVLHFLEVDAHSLVPALALLLLAHRDCGLKS